MSPRLFNQYDQYLENLLCAQYDVADIFDHELAKGESREDFLIRILHDENDHMKIHKGFLTNGHDQSNQCDLIVCKSTTRTRRIGGQTLIDVADHPVLIEVKGNATGTDFREFNIKAGRTKALCSTHDVPCGIFCYKTNLLQRNVLNRFGYRYDALLDPLGIAYLDDPTLAIQYPNIDFAISIEPSPAGGGDKQFFLRKISSTGRYLYSRESPILKHLMSLVRGLTL